MRTCKNAKASTAQRTITPATPLVLGGQFLNYYKQSKKMKTIKNLTQDQREILGGAAVMVAGIAFLFWLTTTVSRPVMDHPSIDQQIYHEKSYELPASFDKYVNHVYNDKYNNQ